jgi:hypothetical protein
LKAKNINKYYHKINNKYIKKMITDNDCKYLLSQPDKQYDDNKKIYRDIKIFFAFCSYKLKTI